ncbi:MAG TPA: AtpZ/AtpI family protein [candidate division Zixibacteria bacterium]
MSKEAPDKYWWVKQASAFTTIPVILLVGPLVGYLIGSFLDRRLGTQPYLMLVLVVLGFAASGKEIYRMIKKFSPKDLDGN